MIKDIRREIAHHSILLVSRCSGTCGPNGSRNQLSVRISQSDDRFEQPGQLINALPFENGKAAERGSAIVRPRGFGG
jgi:hypothetical protein